MKVSIYQFMCLGNLKGGGSTEVKNNRIRTSSYLYASTRDFVAFELPRNKVQATFGISMEILLDCKIGEIKDSTSCDSDYLRSVEIWFNNNRMYVGTLYKHEYPIIVEILPNDEWLRVFYCHEKAPLTDFILRFKDQSDFEIQYAILLAIKRLNVNIALDDVDIPGIYPTIY